MAVPNVYYVIDDSGVTASTAAGGQPAAASGQPLSGEFTAPSGSAAITVAHIIGSALQRPVRVVQKYGGTPPWTLVQNATANVALTSVPSGVSY